MSAVARVRAAQSSARQRLAPPPPEKAPPPPPQQEDDDLLKRDTPPPAPEDKSAEPPPAEVKSPPPEEEMLAPKKGKPESKQEAKASEYTLTLRSGVNGVKACLRLSPPPPSSAHTRECGGRASSRLMTPADRSYCPMLISASPSPSAQPRPSIAMVDCHDQCRIVSLVRLLKSPTDVIL